MQGRFDVPGSAAPDAAGLGPLEAAAPRLDSRSWTSTASRWKARFYALARGSAMECAALFDVLGNLGLVPRPLCLRARGLLVRIVQMHTRLCLRSKA